MWLSRESLLQPETHLVLSLFAGKRDNAYIVTSETCALDTIGAEFVRDIEPGEVITITPEKGIESDMTMALAHEKQARCVFEYIYFARPDSHIDGVSVYMAAVSRLVDSLQWIHRLRLIS